jgi:serine/threonine protein kinase
LKVVGRGSFGKVYLVQKKDNDRLYAMKTLKKDAQLMASQYQSTKGKNLIANNLYSFS